jgi:hypothetical protein
LSGGAVPRVPVHSVRIRAEIRVGRERNHLPAPFPLDDDELVNGREVYTPIKLDKGVRRSTTSRAATPPEAGPWSA